MFHHLAREYGKDPDEIKKWRIAKLEYAFLTTQMINDANSGG